MPRKKTITTLDDLKLDEHNANLGTIRGREMLRRSLEEAGAGRSILVDREGRVIAGNKSLEAWRELADGASIEVVRTNGEKLVVVQRDDLDLDDPAGLARKLALLDNRTAETGLDWDPEQLKACVDAGMDLSGMWTGEELQSLLADVERGDDGSNYLDNADMGDQRQTLAERFIVPPFSVLDARQGYWQDRKRAWIALGIQSELGRGEGVTEGDAPEITEKGLNYYRKRNDKSLGAIAPNEAGDNGILASPGKYAARKVSPGGAPRPAMRLKNGKTVRGDGRGRPL